jgi:hypothetical protein
MGLPLGLGETGPRRKLPNEYLAYPWRTPIHSLSNTYLTPIQLLSDARQMREDYAWRFVKASMRGSDESRRQRIKDD